MNIFGFQIGKDNKTFPIIPDTNISVRVADQGPTIRPELKGIAIPDDKRPANITPVAPNVLTYNNSRSRRGDFLEAEYDLTQIGRIEDTDSYVHQAFLKKIGLLYKEGYEFVGPNPKTIQYVKMRFEQIARASGIPTDELIRAIGSGLIKKSNAFLVKARKESASGGRVRVNPGKDSEIQPIAGYFIAPPETMEVDADKYGRIRRWKQTTYNGEFKYFAKEDVIHFYFNRKEGLMFGTPTLVPVIDDIRALRKIEENIELLIYQHLFPLFHYKIGTELQPATITELGQSEIDIARHEIQYMPSEGGIVTDHRHDIQLIGTENRALRAESYLEHFKKRVFSGLGISAVDMGEGECYDSSTQTLTEKGWKFHWAIDHTKEKIATYSPITKKIEFHLANYKYEAPYVGKMIKFKNDRVDIMVTPNHDMWVKNDNNNWKKMTALEIFNDKAGKVFSFAESAAFWDNECPDLPHEDVVSLASLAALVAARGKAVKDSIFVENRRYLGKEAIHTELTKLGIQWSVKDASKFSKFIVFNKDALDGFFQQFLLPTGLEFAERLPLPIRKVFVRKYVEASFCKNMHRSYNMNNEFITSIKDSLKTDMVQKLIMSAGYSAHVREKHDTKLGHHFTVKANLREKSRHNRFVRSKHVSEVDYGGIIYCYNVPNHLFVTRRGKTVTIQGNTANRATSDNMSRNLVDSVKDIQRTIECQVNDFIVSELLLESTFGDNVLDGENKVLMKFREIDLDHQIKKENHYADLFNKNVISLHEARSGQGRQPFSIPTAKEIESSENIEELFPEWYSTHFKLIDEPKALMLSADEPYSPAAKAAAASRALDVTEGQRLESAEEKAQSEERQEKARAANRPKPKAVSKDSLAPKYNDLESDLVQMVNKDTLDLPLFKQLAIMTRDSMIRDLKSRTMAAFFAGYSDRSRDIRRQAEASIRSRRKIEQRIEFYVERLMRDTVNAVDRQSIADLSKDDRIHRVKAVFDSFRFRNDFMEDVEVRKAYNLGLLEAAKDQGFKRWKIVAKTDSCQSCKNASVEAQSLQSILDLEDVPPLHANARAEIEVLEE